MKQIIGYSMAHVPIPKMEEDIYNGFCKLTLNDGTVVELEGNGTLRYNDISQYRLLATEIEVGKRCTSIEGGFYNFAELVKLTIPNSVTSITSSPVPSITTGCPKLEEINFDAPLPLPSGIAGNYGTLNVNKIIIGPHATGIAEDACRGSQYLASITISSNIKYIGASAFNGCTGLTSVTIGNSVTSIGNYAFNGCTGLTSVSISNSVTSIGDCAFQGCSGLTSVNISDLAAWCNLSFYSTISNPLFYAHHLYLNGTEVTDLVIPNSVTSISNYAFNGCTGLTSVTIPNSVASIGYGAFEDCSGLTSVTIGNSVTSIGNYAFYGCHNLASIILLATTAPTIKSNTFQSVKTNGTLTVPSGSTGYDIWMGIGNYYLGKYNWTKVEQ